MDSQPAPQYLSKEKHQQLQEEEQKLIAVTIPLIAKRIDDAKQMGDLSENAEYHTAREEMAWAQSRIKEIGYILQQAQIIDDGFLSHDIVQIGSKITVEAKGKKKEYTIVGAQEADPLAGKISNESPLGVAFLGKKTGDTVHVQVPAGNLEYTVLEIE